jgi:predicted DNA-binding transcriptional regulator AlpA
MKPARRSSSIASAHQLSFLFEEAAPCAQPIASERKLSEKPAPSSSLTIVGREQPTRSKKAVKQVAAAVGHEDRRLTVEEAAQTLSVSVKTLEAWRRLGKGPMFVKLGRSVRYTMRALDQFTLERTVTNSAEGRMLDVRR